MGNGSGDCRNLLQHQSFYSDLHARFGFDCRLLLGKDYSKTVIYKNNMKSRYGPQTRDFLVLAITNVTAVAALLYEYFGGELGARTIHLATPISISVASASLILGTRIRNNRCGKALPSKIVVTALVSIVFLTCFVWAIVYGTFNRKWASVKRKHFRTSAGGWPSYLGYRIRACTCGVPWHHGVVWKSCL